MGKICIVEDEDAISNLMKISLEMTGYHTLCLSDGKSLIEILEKEEIDLILLDVMLPNEDGFSLIKKIRRYQIPVIFVTARFQVSDRVTGLQLGAEDYLCKPFEMVELVARVETVLRRFGKKSDILQFQTIELNESSREVKKEGQIVELTYKEFDLLAFLIRNQNIALYREEILEKIWHDEYEGTTRTVDIHIASLRKKLGLNHQIVSVFKVGYRLENRL